LPRRERNALTASFQSSPEFQPTPSFAQTAAGGTETVAKEASAAGLLASALGAWDMRARGAPPTAQNWPEAWPTWGGEQLYDAYSAVSDFARILLQ